VKITHRQLRQLIKDSLLTEDFDSRSGRRAIRSYDRDERKDMRAERGWRKDYDAAVIAEIDLREEISQWRGLIDSLQDLIVKRENSELTVGDFFGARGEGGRWWREVDTLKKTSGMQLYEGLFGKKDKETEDSENLESQYPEEKGKVVHAKVLHGDPRTARRTLDQKLGNDQYDIKGSYERDGATYFVGVKR
jgi:hypothetical protein